MTNHYARPILLLPALAATAFLSAQTLTDLTSVPAVGTVENRSYHTDFTATGFATSGTGNVWLATGLIPSGITSTTTYRLPGDSPYASMYPGTTLCAERYSDSPTAEWRHYNITASTAELLGVNTDEFVGGRTYCEFPFDMGDSFTDSYTISGTTLTDDIQYVASGSIQAPWGTVPDVVMFAVNGGFSYLFCVIGNVIDPIGSYVPGFGLDLWQVEIVTGVGGEPAQQLGIMPVPAHDRVHLALPFSEGRVTIADATGRVVREGMVRGTRMEIDVRSIPQGIYTVTAIDVRGRRTTGRMVVE